VFAGMDKIDLACVAGTLSPWQSMELEDVVIPETSFDPFEKLVRLSTCGYPCEPLMGEKYMINTYCHI